MSSDCLRLICDDQIEIIKITENLYDAAMELFRNYFMVYENVSIACDLAESPETVNEMMSLVKAILKDRISFAARDIKTQELVAICLNKFVNPPAGITLDDVFASFQTPNMKTVGHYLHTIECTRNIFQEWQIECAIELNFLSTNPAYARRGIAVSLANYLLDYAARLKEDDCPECLQLPDHLRAQKPEAVIAVFTSFYSQRVGDKLGFQTIFKEENSKFVYGGRTFADKIDPQHKYSTFAAKRL